MFYNWEIGVIPNFYAIILHSLLKNKYSLSEVKIMNKIEKVVDEKLVNSSSYVLYILALSPIIYLTLLFALVSVDLGESTTKPNDELLNYLRIGLVGITILVIFIGKGVVEPKIQTIDNFSKSFSMYLIISVCYEIIGMLALLLGLLEIFVFLGYFDIFLVTGVMIVSLVTNIIFIQTVAKPKMLGFLGTTTLVTNDRRM